jgi:hypothetical protein
MGKVIGPESRWFAKSKSMESPVKVISYPMYMYVTEYAGGLESAI